MVSVSGLTILPAGERRVLETQRRGEKGFGKSLRLHELSSDDGVTIHVHFVGPVSQGSRPERLAYYDIKIGL